MIRKHHTLLLVSLVVGCAAIEDETSAPLAGDDVADDASANDASAVDSTSPTGDDGAEDSGLRGQLPPVTGALPSSTADLSTQAADPPAFGVLSLQTDGHMVDAFGGDGIVGTHFPTFDSMRGTAVGSSGSDVILGGTAFRVDAPSQWAFAKYNSSGALIAAFDGDGRKTQAWASASSAILEDMVVVGSSIYAVGTVQVGGFDRMGVAKFSATTGALQDSTYVSFPSMTWAAGKAIKVVGTQIIVGGVVGVTGDKTRLVALAKLNTSNLSLVASFGGDGKVVHDIGEEHSVAALAIDGTSSSYKIVLGGSAEFGSGSEMWVTRYSSSGTLDATFDGNGIRRIPVGDPAHLHDLDVVSSKVTVVGTKKASGVPNAMAVARLNANGSLDATCDGNGLKEIAFANNPAVAQGVTVGSRIFIAGNVGENFGVVQLMPDCSEDTGFDGDGRRTIDVTTHDDGASIMINGSRIYVGGTR